VLANSNQAVGKGVEGYDRLLHCGICQEPSTTAASPGTTGCVEDDDTVGGAATLRDHFGLPRLESRFAARPASAR